MKRLVFLIPLIFLAGCSIDYKCEVYSNTEWKGTFGNKPVGGFGYWTIDIPDDEPQCCIIHKETEDGYLGARIIAEGGWFLNNPDDGDYMRTDSTFGEITVCSGK